MSPDPSYFNNKNVKQWASGRLPYPDSGKSETEPGI